MAFGRNLSNALSKLSLSDNGQVDDELVIGIDFGTTYTGVAWATTADFNTGEINLITSWPDNGREEGKVPTELWINENGEPAWGYEVPADSDPFRWFKLLLLQAEDLGQELSCSEYVTRCRAMIEQSGLTVLDIVAEYFRLLWEHIESTIERSCGEAVVEDLPFHVVITVPAIWKSYTRQIMEEAAMEAGILKSRMAGDTKLTFVPEPEAAALLTLLEQNNGVRAGNVYVVCDAGGGTVDLISYEVKSTKPIILAEAVEGTGSLCGGIFIDQTFEHMCKGRLGSKWKRLSKRGMNEIMRDQWEYGIKPRFCLTKARKDYIVCLPAEAFGSKDPDPSSLDDTSHQPYIKNGRIYFRSSDIKNVFEDVFADIKNLVDGQIESATSRGLSVTGVILVGGLGSSPYLYDYLKAAHSDDGIQVLQSGGIKPRTAICRGAVIKGFLEGFAKSSSLNAQAPIAIGSIVSRASYGICFQEDFDPLVHPKKDRIWDAVEGIYKARRQMRWYLKRGEMVSKLKRTRHHWYRLFEKGGFSGSLSITLCYCEDLQPPTRLRSSVKKLGRFSCDLDVEYSDLQEFSSANGTRVKKLCYDIELIPSGASVEFIVYVGGREQGRSKRERIRFLY